MSVDEKFNDEEFSKRNKLSDLMPSVPSHVKEAVIDGIRDAEKIHDALVICYNATPDEHLRELIALIEVMILRTLREKQ